MFRLVAIAAGLSCLLGGCALLPPLHEGGLATRVTPDEYGRRLCKHLDLEDYAGCVSEVLEYFETPRANDIAPGRSTSGPIVLMLEEQVYRGHYASTSPFAASFKVSNGVNACSASYNVNTGSADALFDVYCSDGRSGWADLVLALDGRNGIGKLALDDGAQGEIVFGYLPLGQAEPYPYKP